MFSEKEKKNAVWPPTEVSDLIMARHPPILETCASERAPVKESGTLS